MNQRHPRTPRPGRFTRGRSEPAQPMLLGQPSPSLAKINEMNMVKLEAKIGSLDQEKVRVTARLDQLTARADPPQAKIKAVTELLARLDALKAAAAERLAGKAERKAARERRS